MAEDTVKYVYTKKFAIYSKGVGRVGALRLCGLISKLNL